MTLARKVAIDAAFSFADAGKAPERDTRTRTHERGRHERLGALERCRWLRCELARGPMRIRDLAPVRHLEKNRQIIRRFFRPISDAHRAFEGSHTELLIAGRQCKTMGRMRRATGTDEKREAQITIRIPQYLRDALDAEAARERRSIADLVIFALEDRYTTTKKKGGR